MIKFENKNIFFSGRGEKIDKEELLKYFIQNNATIVEDIKTADIIIQGYMTPVYLEDKFYLLAKDGIEVITIEKIEKEFSENLDIDSIVMAIKISKDKERLIKLLKNRYFSDDIFVILLKYYDWEKQGLHDTDENRDVSTAIVSRFCSLQETNHNIQYAPIGVYYTALETTNAKLLEIIYNMPMFRISDKNTVENQPHTLKEVVALNPNSSKTVLMQILKDANLEELKFLSLNESINKFISNKLFTLGDKTIIENLIKSNNISLDNIYNCLENKLFKKQVLKYINLTDELFEKLCKDIGDIDVVYLSSNETLTKEQIEVLFLFEIDSVNINLLKNKNCSMEKIKEFLEKDDKIYNITIAHNTALDESIYVKLEKLHDFDVDITLAFNPNSPRDILEKLYKKNKHEINMGLSQNENTPINILMQLQVDGAYSSNVANNETYKEFSRNSLGIIQNDSNRFKRSTYTVN
ncbi:MAG: hypothetical protein U9R37_03245 [Campylobacterota bacterium]|nr:hypothetical protein [Campylobacterota bacterium]